MWKTRVLERQRGRGRKTWIEDREGNGRGKGDDKLVAQPMREGERMKESH
jgi:hypothetical protein